MKHLSVLAALIISSSMVFAQDATTAPKSAPSTLTFVSKTAKLAKYHNEVELEKLGKLELTDLYLERIAIVTELVPYLALHRNPSGATLGDLGIPETKNNVDQLEKEIKNKEHYITTLKTTLHDIVPYADKGNIIWCILFLEEVIHKIEKSGTTVK